MRICLCRSREQNNGSAMSGCRNGRAVSEKMAEQAETVCEKLRLSFLHPHSHCDLVDKITM